MELAESQDEDKSLPLILHPTQDLLDEDIWTRAPPTLSQCPRTSMSTLQPCHVCLVMAHSPATALSQGLSPISCSLQLSTLGAPGRHKIQSPP